MTRPPSSTHSPPTSSGLATGVEDGLGAGLEGRAWVPPAEDRPWRRAAPRTLARVGRRLLGWPCYEACCSSHTTVTETMVWMAGGTTGVGAPAALESTPASAYGMG